MKYIIFLCTAILLPTSLVNTDSSVTPNPLCPFPSEDFVRFPFEGDCTKYWECFEGQRYTMSCPEGFEFNQVTEVCDFPELANCNGDATVTYPTFTTPTPTTPGTGPTSPPQICPSSTSNEMTYVAHPTNCSLYYECYQGMQYLMECPNGLVFNMDAKYCDYPTNVDCSSRTSTTEEPVTPSTATPITDTPTTATPTPVTPSTSTTSTTPSTPSTSTTTTPSPATTGTTSPTQKTPNPLCPYPSEDFVRFPFQGDCSKFWECFEGQRYPMSCPDGFEFNQEKEVCDFPNEANCSGNSTVTYPTFTTPTPTTPGTGPTTPTTTVWTPDPICSYPSNELTYVAHPTDCNLYYECYQGLKYLMACPSGLYFNVEGKYCDYPANVDCSHTSTDGPTTETTPTTTDNTTRTTTTPDPTGTTPTFSTSSTTTTTTEAPTNVCANVPDGTFLSDPYDCRKFYECLYGNVITSECPQHLLWNEAKLTCDYPENVVCEKIYILH